MPRKNSVGRRALGRWLAAGAAGTVMPGAGYALAQTRQSTLILALDVADTVTFDPARQINYSPPLVIRACYDTLVTMIPDRYDAVVPCLAASWERTPDGQGWRFTLRPDAVFASGNKVTPEDCAFSVNRLLAIGDPPAHYLDIITTAVASGEATVDILLAAPDRPLLAALASPTFAILERAAVEAQNAAPGAQSADQATQWLDQHSAGSGAYALAGWRRRVGIQLEANPHSWRGPPGYPSVTIRHMPDSTAQLRALQRGDVDAAFNLIPEQISQLQADTSIRVETTRSLDMVYVALNADPLRNKALSNHEARQAVGYAIDYEDLLGRMLGGTAVRPASFLPVGVPGSGETTVSEIGFRQDLGLARNLLASAGLADGFTFELSYSDNAIAGLSYETLARKLRTDLARVGIVVRLMPTNAYAWRDAYFGGKSEAALAFWTSPIVDDAFWARASLERLAKRVGLDPPAALRDLVARAEAESQPAAQARLWLDYQKAMISLANLIVLFQPSYQVAVRDSVAKLPLTAAGWMANLDEARPRTG